MAVDPNRAFKPDGQSEEQRLSVDRFGVWDVFFLYVLCIYINKYTHTLCDVM